MTNSSPAKRLLFVHQHLGAWGGAEVNVLLTGEELRRRGYEVGLAYACETGRDEAKWVATFSPQFRLPVRGNAEHIEAVLDQFEPDLVYLHSVADLEVVEAFLASGVPVVRMVHDHALYCLREYKYHVATRRICQRPVSPRCIFPCLGVLKRNRGGTLPLKWVSYGDKLRELELNRRCDRLVVYSEYAKEELVRNGFDPGRIDIRVPIRCWGMSGPVSTFSERNLILFAGQIIRGKGVDVLLRALARVKAPFECHILGEGNHRGICEKLCRKLGLGNRVKFRGFLSPEESQPLYLEASAFAVSSVWPEPFGMVGPEAMRYGLPVVAFDSGGIREWLTDGENGFLVPWMDINTFAARLDQLLGDKPLARALGRNGLERVNREYEAATQVGRLEETFLRLMNGTPGITHESPSHLFSHGNRQ